MFETRLAELVSIMVLAIPHITFSYSEMGVYFYQEPRFQNKLPGNADGSLTLLTDRIHMEYSCAILCKNHTACLSFFIASQQCLGYDKIMTNHIYSRGHNVSEVQYYEISGPIHNVALGKPTGEGYFFIHYGYEMRAFRSVDGIRDGNNLITANPQSCFVNDAPKQEDRYMFVNLLDKYFITLVKIMVRETCCSERFQKIAISVGDTLTNLQRCYFFDPPTPPSKGEMVLMPCGKSGRFMEVRTYYPTSLGFCELEILGYPLRQ